MIVLADGTVAADATPGQVRARAGRPVIRYRPPRGVPFQDLPPALAARVNPQSAELSVRSADLTADLDALVCWARRNHVDLAVPEVGPPSLEDAFLELTGDTPAARPGRPEPSH